MIKPSKIISSVATPIARTLSLDCIDPETNELRPDSNCTKRGDRIDRWTESIYNYFVHPENRKENETMKYKVQLIIVVDAENTMSAVDQFKTLKGEVTNFSINPVLAPAAVVPGNPLKLPPILPQTQAKSQ